MARIWVLRCSRSACFAKRFYGPSLGFEFEVFQVCLLCENVPWPESGFQVYGPRSVCSAKMFYGPNLGFKFKVFPRFACFAKRLYCPNVGFEFEVFPGLLALRKRSMALWP